MKAYVILVEHIPTGFKRVSQESYSTLEKAKQNNSKTFGYEWNRKDGAIIELSITIKEKDK